MRQMWRFVKTVAGVVFRRPLPGTTIVPVLPDGRIVLIRRRDTGEWGLPGGLVDWGEDVPTAAKRELAEETGLELTNVRRLVGVYSDPDRDPRIHSISILVEADARGEIAVRDTLEIIEARPFDRQDLPQENLCHDHKRQIADFLSGTTALA